MRTTCLVIVMAAAFVVQSTDAQQPRPPAQTAPEVQQTLRAVGLALGELRGPNFVDAISTIEFWANGTMNALGQAFKAGDPWPAFKVTSYHAWIDFKQPAMRVDLTRTNPDVPTKGGGGLPLAAPQRLGFVNMNYFNPQETTPDASTHNYTSTVSDKLTIGQLMALRFSGRLMMISTRGSRCWT